MFICSLKHAACCEQVKKCKTTGAVLYGWHSVIAEIIFYEVVVIGFPDDI